MPFLDSAPRRSWQFLWMLVSLSSAGCGDAIVPAEADGSGPGGSGGAGQGAGGGWGGGSGGLGGAGGEGMGGQLPNGCSALVVEGIRAVENDDGWSQLDPVLVHGETSQMGETDLALLVYAELLVPGPAVPGPHLSFASFEPWGAWSSDPIAPDGQAFYAAASFATGPAEQAFGGYALLVDSPEDGLQFAPTWGLGAWPLYDVDEAMGGSDVDARFVAHAEGHHLLGVQRTFGSDHQLVVGSFTGDDVTTEQPACASSSLAAAAAFAGSHYVVATGSAPTWGPCGSSTLVPPSEVHIAVAEPGEPLVHAAAFSSAIGGTPGLSVDQVEVVTSRASTWVLWKYVGAPNQEAAIYGVRIDPATLETSEPIQVGRTQWEPDRFAATALGDRLVIARTEELINPRSVHVALLDSSGKELDMILVMDNAGIGVEPPYSLLASPDGTGLVASFRGEDGTLRVTRLHCE